MIKMEYPLLEPHKDLISAITRFHVDLDFLIKCLDPSTPTHEVSLSKLFGFEIRVFHSLPRVYHDEAKELLTKLNTVLLERGYRKDIITYQEHKLVGSTEDEKFQERPYAPLGILRAGLSLKETQMARNLQRRLMAIGIYFGKEGKVRVSLEPLGPEGNTMQDPRLLDDTFNPLETQYNSDFPFRRTRL